MHSHGDWLQDGGGPALVVKSWTCWKVIDPKNPNNPLWTLEPVIVYFPVLEENGQSQQGM